MGAQWSMGELAPQLICCATSRQETDALHPCHLGQVEGCLRCHESGRTDPVPHLLQHTGEQALHLGQQSRVCPVGGGECK